MNIKLKGKFKKAPRLKRGIRNMRYDWWNISPICILIDLNIDTLRYCEKVKDVCTGCQYNAIHGIITAKIL